LQKTKSKTSLKNKCDDLWKKIIHLKGYCEVCGTPYGLNAHHIIGKVNYNLRWDIRNGCLLCITNHKFGKLSAHQNPLWFVDWLKKNRSKDYKYLKDYKFQIMKTWYVSDYEKIIKDLEDILNEIQK